MSIRLRTEIPGPRSRALMATRAAEVARVHEVDRTLPVVKRVMEDAPHPAAQLSVPLQVDARSAVQVTVTAILINILNPKLSIFFLAFLPQFVSADEAAPLVRMLALSAVFMLMTFVVFVGYGLFAASIRDHVISRPRILTWLRRSFAGAFAALGARLAFADR